MCVYIYIYIYIYVHDLRYYGALSKSNFTMIRSRDCVYASVRELVMSYWDFYFNTAGEKTLRRYTQPFRPFKDFKGVKGREDRHSWLFHEQGHDASELEKAFDRVAYVPLVPKGVDTRRQDKKHEHASAFGKAVFTAPKILVQGGTLDSNPAGLYKL